MHSSRMSDLEPQAEGTLFADVNASLSNLTKTTGDLARSVEEMRVDIKAHDAQAKEILALVQKPAPKPRAKKTNDGNPTA